jgi:hypothetical protein
MGGGSFTVVPPNGNAEDAKITFTIDMKLWVIGMLPMFELYYTDATYHTYKDGSYYEDTPVTQITKNDFSYDTTNGTQYNFTFFTG